MYIWQTFWTIWYAPHYGRCLFSIDYRFSFLRTTPHPSDKRMSRWLPSRWQFFVVALHVGGVCVILFVIGWFLWPWVHYRSAVFITTGWFSRVRVCIGRIFICWHLIGRNPPKRLMVIGWRMSSICMRSWTTWRHTEAERDKLFYWLIHSVSWTITGNSFQL